MLCGQLEKFLVLVPKQNKRQKSIKGLTCVNSAQTEMGEKKSIAKGSVSSEQEKYRQHVNQAVAVRPADYDRPVFHIGRES